MATLNSRQITQIKRVIHSCLDEVPYHQQLWQRMHQEYGIGHKMASSLKLNALDRSRLSEIVTNLTGELLEPGDRKDSAGFQTRTERAASGVFNEKAGSIGPMSQIIGCTVLRGDLYYRGECIKTFPGIEYRLDHNELDIERYERIVLVENYDTFRTIDQINWPHSDALIVYRGHDHAARAVNAMLRRTRPEQTVIAFTDSDPAGVLIALGYEQVNALLIPERQSWESLEKRSVFDRYTEQINVAHPRLKRLRDSSLNSDQLVRYIDWIVRGVAVSQESLIGMSVPLEQVSIRQVELVTDGEVSL